MFERQKIEHKRIYEPKEQEQARRFADKLKKDNVEFRYAHEYVEFRYAHEYVFGGVATIITWEEDAIIKNPKK